MLLNKEDSGDFIATVVYFVFYLSTILSFIEKYFRKEHKLE